MHAAREDLPASIVVPGVLTSRHAQWGDINVAIERIAVGDATDFFAARLPDGRCLCPHWGYVIEGRLRIKYAEHDEVISAGEVFYLPPGHVPVIEETAEVIEFSPIEAYQRTTVALMSSQP